jgi:DHA1 family bicyclomycin/chloramphenicol resistance-like MFS transporter
VSGFVSDRFGRKPPIITGIVLFGASFALLGIAPSPISVLVQETTFGVAWGFCMVAYFAVPGDLAGAYSGEKYYALYTVLPFISFTATLTMPLILGFSAPMSILSPVLSILLFLSVLPVLYASETLPETVLNERRLREHISKIGKIVDESKKTQ